MMSTFTRRIAVFGGWALLALVAAASHADTKFIFVLFGLYAKVTTIVYGD